MDPVDQVIRNGWDRRVGMAAYDDTNGIAIVDDIARATGLTQARVFEGLKHDDEGCSVCDCSC